MSDSATNIGPQAPAKTYISPKEAVAWFLGDMAEVSGYALTEDWSKGKRLSAYATYRPILTAPDPWYFAAVVALESCKICDLFPSDQANEILREVLTRMDATIGLRDDSASALTFLVMGRLGMGALLMHRKVPDNLLAKVMLILIGSPSAAAPQMPSETAHEQIRAALSLGQPVWWAMFRRRFTMKTSAPRPRLVPSVLAAAAPSTDNAP